MSSRKKVTTVSFTTSIPMQKVMEVVGQLYEAGSVQNFHVEEIDLAPKKMSPVLHRSSMEVPAGEGRVA